MKSTKCLYVQYVVILVNMINDLKQGKIDLNDDEIVPLFVAAMCGVPRVFIINLRALVQ